jgi:Fe2+ transport system protein B
MEEVDMKKSEVKQERADKLEEIANKAMTKKHSKSGKPMDKLDAVMMKNMMGMKKK